MRLATIETAAGPRAAVRTPGGYLDVHAADPSLPSGVRQILEGGPALLGKIEALARQTKGPFLPLNSRLHAPIPDPFKIVCVGLNYRDHAAESNSPIPRDPILFSKYATALVGPEEAIVLPPVSQKVDYEAELVIVIGKQGRNIPVERAREYVAGYAVGHDVSARDWQLEKDGKQWMAGKTFDTFAPLGPELVLADEVPDPHALRIQLRLNGETMQDSSTEQMIFTVDQLVAYLSQIVTIQPGDLIYTGTPPGVGMARKPSVWLKDGDVVEVEIEGLGVLRNPVRQG